MATHEHHDEHGRGGQHGAEISAGNLSKEDRDFLEKHKDKLSRTTLTAKWINKPGEKADRPGQSLATRSHDVIKHWAEERKATPATVPGTEHGGRPGVLRFDFPGYGGKDLEKISWDDWFKTFDSRHLVFVFQQEQSGGNQSNFFMFDSPQREHD